ncbi:MAG: NF038122 family metalloprotease [Xenococcaceae cyanobacterium MO_188.B29]|nr:NF038122 family metalloprotease [Xenococcaceae cyanobacterium MO_188.B29]
MKTNKLTSLFNFYNFTFTFSVSIGVGIITNSRIAKAVEFQLIYDSNIDTQALAGFQEAAAIWESKFTDSMTINLNIGFKSLAPNVLGTTGSKSNIYTYSRVGNALIQDKTSRDDTIATSNLPGFSSLSMNNGLSKHFDFVGTEEDGSLEITDVTNGGITTDNTSLFINRANAKALGLIDSYDLADDTSITFSSDFPFDFNRNDGIDNDKFDFVGIALHEIGHAMGFTSGMNTVDRSADVDPDTGNTPSQNGTDLDGATVFKLLDIFRYSDLSAAIGEDTNEKILDLSVGDNPVEYNGVIYDGNPYLSIDGGDTILTGVTDGTRKAFMSTGVFNGDGRQTSHWKQDLGIGLFNPTISPGELLVMSDLDVRALDIIGYDSVTATVPFDFSPSLGIFIVGGVYSLRRFWQHK